MKRYAAAFWLILALIKQGSGQSLTHFISPCSPLIMLLKFFCTTNTHNEFFMIVYYFLYDPQNEIKQAATVPFRLYVNDLCYDWLISSHDERCRSHYRLFNTNQITKYGDILHWFDSTLTYKLLIQIDFDLMIKAGKYNTSCMENVTHICFLRERRTFKKCNLISFIFWYFKFLWKLLCALQ